MLKMMYVSCGHSESFRRITKESVGMGNEEERNTGSFS